MEGPWKRSVVSCIAAEKSLVGPDLLPNTSQTMQAQYNSFAMIVAGNTYSDAGGIPRLRRICQTYSKLAQDYSRQLTGSVVLQLDCHWRWLRALLRLVPHCMFGVSSDMVAVAALLYHEFLFGEDLLQLMTVKSQGCCPWPTAECEWWHPTVSWWLQLCEDVL